MRKLLPLFFITPLFISGCLTPKKIDSRVSDHYGEINNGKPGKQGDYLYITSPLITNDLPVSTTVKTSKNLLPLLFYWQCDYFLTCKINPKIPVNMCESAIRKYANSKSLKQKLNNASVSLTVKSIPNSFVLFERDHVIWVIYAFSWVQQAFTPQLSDLVVSYQITQNGAVIKNGLITVPDNDKPLNVKYMNSVKKLEDQYLDQYDENIEMMSKKVVDELIHELP
ncbi:MAG TPA: hypothetical protein VIJ95_01505 [Hanamia sp.]